jgi:hypothetical protein
MKIFPVDKDVLPAEAFEFDFAKKRLQLADIKNILASVK